MKINQICCRLHADSLPVFLYNACLSINSINTLHHGMPCTSHRILTHDQLSKLYKILFIASTHHINIMNWWQLSMVCCTYEMSMPLHFIDNSISMTLFKHYFYQCTLVSLKSKFVKDIG